MGKRKAARKAPPKAAKSILDKTFTCLFCNHENAIECKMHRDQQFARLTCRVCGVHWETGIHNLSEPIDVYSDWIDACEEAEKQKASLGDAADTDPTAMTDQPVLLQQQQSRRERTTKSRPEEEGPSDDEEPDSDDQDFVTSDEEDLEADMPFQVKKQRIATDATNKVVADEVEADSDTKSGDEVPEARVVEPSLPKAGMSKQRISDSDDESDY